MQIRKMVQLGGAVALLMLAACNDDAEEPESEKSAGDEIEESANAVADDVDEAADEAEDEVDEEL